MEEKPKTGPVALSARHLKRQALYVNLDNPRDPDLLFENAEKVADIHGPLPVLDYLYDFAREPKLPREAWTRQALVATCIQYLLGDFFYGEPPWSMTHLFDPVARDQAVRALASPRGLVALTFHGGFAVGLLHFFAAFVNDGLMIAPKARAQFGSLSARDSGPTLFAALRALGEGRTVHIAPDGQFGRARSDIQVLGASCPVSDGAAFLAYETGCDTAWYVMLRKGRMFAPLVLPGPSRAPGESFNEFRTRLQCFYEERIEEQLTGAPESLAISLTWRKPLQAAMEQRRAALRRAGARTGGRPE